MGRADGVRRMQNETECPIGEEFFGAGTVSGGVYPCLFSGDGGTGLLADREPDDPADTARAWVPAPEEECGRLLQFLYENSVQPELWQDAISCWYPQAEQAENLREGGASCEL